MRFEFTENGEALFFFMHSLRTPSDTVTKVVDAESGKVMHEFNNWHNTCKEPICDAALLLQDKSQLLLATPTKGIFLANASTCEVKALVTPRDLHIAFTVEALESDVWDLLAVRIGLFKCSTLTLIKYVVHSIYPKGTSGPSRYLQLKTD